jgi:enoyl-CoA hydratase/carnithine racemase
MTEQLDIQIRGHVAEVSFQHPPHNFANIQLMRLLADALQQLDDEQHVRVILLMSQGKVFCAGADLVSDNGFGGQTNDPLREFYDQVIRLFAGRKPVIAVIQGAAIGAGLGLAVAADFRVASVDARFSANFVKLGFHPGFGLTYTLPRLVGHQRAAQMLLTASRYKAEEMAAWGLVDRLCDAEHLLTTARAFANEIAENAPLSLLATRATLRGDMLEQVKAALAHEHQEQLKLKFTEDFAEGIRAVTERRPGIFKGR